MENAPTTSKPKMLWHTDYWDVPRDGVAEYEGRKVWFVKSNLVPDLTPAPAEEAAPIESKDLKNNIDDEEEDEGPLMYTLFDVTDSVMQRLIAAQELFAEKVGSHTYHDPALYKPFTKEHDEIMAEYYDKPKDQIASNKEEILKGAKKIKTILRSDFEWFRRPM